MKVNQIQSDQLLALAKTFNEIVECIKRFIEWVQEKWNLVKATWFDEYHQLVEKKENLYKHQRLMSFARIKIKHQVIDRKPKQMIRKIIH